MAPFGNITFLSITWENGNVYKIDRVLNRRRAASLKAGGIGFRYTFRILGREKLFILLRDKMVYREGKAMCGRYNLYFDDEYDNDIAKMMDNIKRDYPQTEIKLGEIFPTNTAPVLIRKKSEIVPVPYIWGFPDYRRKGVIINARAETAEEKRTFRDSLLNRRCVIPSTGFYEWDKSKQKYLFNMPDNNALYMAGFYNVIKEEPRFIILTTDANASVRSVHHRMPLVLEKSQISKWITDTNCAVSILHCLPPMLKSMRI